MSYVSILLYIIYVYKPILVFQLASHINAINHVTLKNVNYTYVHKAFRKNVLSKIMWISKASRLVECYDENVCL